MKRMQQQVPSGVLSMSRRMIYGATAILAALTVTGGTSYAIEQDTTILPSVTITATRTMKDIEAVPSAVSVVTAKEIEARRVDTVADALQLLPGVYKRQTGNGGLQIRGFESTNILVLVDGVPMHNTFNNGVDWEAIPVHSIERIELVKGVGSSLYGGRAVAGVINITMKKIKPNSGAKDITFHGEIGYGEQNTWNNELGFDAHLSSKVAAGLSLEERRTNGFPGYFITASPRKLKSSITAVIPDGAIPKTKSGAYLLGSRGDKSFHNRNLSTYVTVDLGDKKSLTYRYIYSNHRYSYDTPYTHVYVKGKPVFEGNIQVSPTEYVYSGAYKFLGYDGLRQYHQHGLTYQDDKNHVQVSLGLLDKKKDGYSSPDEPMDTSYTGAGDDSSYPGRTYHIDVQKVWDHVGKHTIVAGLNGKEENFNQKRRFLTHWRDHRSFDSTYAPGGLYQQNQGATRNTAVFAQDEFRPNSNWAIYTGLRVDHFKKFHGETKNYNYTTNTYDVVRHGVGTYTEWSPKLAVEYSLTDSMNLYASYGHSFNPPALSRVYRYERNAIANPDLRPETSDSYELGVKKTWGEDTTLNASTFYVKTKDTVSYVYFYDNNWDVDHKQYYNVGEETRRGVEIELRHQLSPHWSVFGNYTWQIGHLRSRELPYTNVETSVERNYEIPKHIFHGGIEYTSSRWHVLWDAQYISRRQAKHELTGDIGSEDAYFITNLSANYKVFKDATLQVGVQNLLNRHYYAGEGTDGRTYTASMKYKF